MQIDELQMQFQIWQTEELCKQDADAGIIEKNVERSSEAFLLLQSRGKVRKNGGNV